MARCTRCGATLAPGAQFCDICGSPLSQPAAPAAYERARPSARAPSENSAPAIASMICGVAGGLFVWIPWLAILSIPLAVISVLLGGLSLGAINKGERRGRGFAWAGIITGSVTLALIVFLWLFLSAVFRPEFPTF